MISLFVSVPVAAFRVPQAREYLETLPVPPPATVYGMLLSLVGEPDRQVHVGSELGVAVLGPEAARSIVLRTSWRVKDLALPPGIGENRRPDFQEVLTGVRLAVVVRAGDEPRAAVPLEQRVAAALTAPAGLRRFGGLCLGESSHLVDEIRKLRSDDGGGRWLVRDPQGRWSLPTWVDHVGSSGTTWERFALGSAPEPLHPVPEGCWARIGSPQ